jgi:anti-sigma-K factor RskA
MSEPKTPELPGVLPPDWSVSSVTATAIPAAAQPAVPAVPPAEVEPARAEPARAEPARAEFSSVQPARPLPARADYARVEPPRSSLLVDPDLLGAIGSWQVQRTPSAPVAAPVAAPAAPHAVASEPFRQIAAAQAPAEPPAAPLVAAAVAQTPAPAPAPAPAAAQVAAPIAEPPIAAPAAAGRRQLTQRVGFWRATTALATLAAAVLALHANNQPAAFDQAVAPIGVVNSPSPIYLAELGDGRLRVTPLAIVAVPAAKDLQLWMFLADSQTPVSLGVLPASGGIFTLPQLPDEGARFVISLEPHGGSPPGKIAGQVLYGGTLAKR